MAEPTTHSAGCSTFDTQRHCFSECTFCAMVTSLLLPLPPSPLRVAPPERRGHARLRWSRISAAARWPADRCISAAARVPAELYFRPMSCRPASSRLLRYRITIRAAVRYNVNELLTAAEAEETQAGQDQIDTKGSSHIRIGVSSRRPVLICSRCSTRPFLSAN